MAQAVAPACLRDWLDRQGAEIRHVVLDDADDGFMAADMPFVETWGGTGLTEVDADRAISLLGRSASH